jgi:rubrerythrin
LSDSGFQGSDRQGASGGPIPSRPSSKLRRCDAPLQIVPAHVDPAARHARSAPAGRCATTFRTPEAAGISIPARHISCKLLRKTRRAHVALSAAKECIMKDQQLHELLFQAIETEQGGIQIYRTAIECAINDDLKEEWEEYLEQTENHVTVLENALTELELDPETETPGRLVVRHIGESLVKAMEMARESDSPDVAQLVATECVVLAETKDHHNWELIAACAEKAKGSVKKILAAAVEEVEEEEDEHLYHSAGWSRELWIDALGLPAVLPPPEEEKDVKTAIGAARAKSSREQLL